jgi:hypothetical protein
MKNVPKLLTNFGITALLVLTLPTNSAIYRSVDAAGNITYSDQQPAAQASDPRTISEQIEVLPPNTFVDSTPPTPFEPGQPDIVDGTITYRSLEITAPPDREAFRDNAGNVVVRSRLAPALHDGDALHLELNGTLLAEPAAGGDVYLTDVPRGTHRIRMVVVDQNGRRKFESKEQIFHLQRYSALQNRPASN